MTLAPLIIPQPTPARQVPGYKMPATTAHLLPWEFVVERMQEARHFWINTVSADGRPHSAPVWGLWHENRLHFDGSPKTLWGTNLVANPNVAIHTSDAARVVLIEGRARMLEDDALSEAEWGALDGRFQAKYAVDHGSPFWLAEPRRIMAWDGEDLLTMTRWRFSDG